MDRTIREMVYGRVQMRSPWFSNNWRMVRDGSEVLRVRRLGRIYTSMVALPDKTRWVLDPHGAGVVRALDSEGNEFARVIRRSWVGRRWELVSPHWNFELVSRSRPRAWDIEIGGSPAAEIRGSLISYNSVDVHALIGVPLAAVLLSWHVIARPWEAVAEPSGLLPVRPTETPAERRARLNPGHGEFLGRG